MLETVPFVAAAIGIALLVGCRCTPSPGSSSAATSAVARPSRPPAPKPSALRGDSLGAAESSAPRNSAASAPSATAPTQPAKVERLDVPGQAAAWLVKSRNGAPPRILFLPGVCSNAGAYLYGFTETARAFGGALAIDGDRPCGAGGDFHSITSDPTHEQPRIDQALAAAG